MPAYAAPLLEHHRVFHSHDAEETRAFLSGKGYRFDLPPRQATQLDARLNAVYLPGMYVAYVEYGSLPIELAPGLARSDYLVQLPIRGHLAAKLAGASIDCDPNRAAIISPTRARCRLLSNAGSVRMQLALTQTAMVEQLTALLGEPPAQPPEFAPGIDLTTGYGRTLAQFVLMAAADLDRSESALANPIATSMFAQFILTGLLQSHPNTYSEALRRCERPIASRDVKRAIDYLEAHLDTPITVADIAQASGVPGRTLFKHFSDSRGTSPIRYLREARFRKVREALTRAKPGETVTFIATRWGFSHLSRFSAEYRKRFGENPSETLRSRQ